MKKLDEILVKEEIKREKEGLDLKSQSATEFYSGFGGGGFGGGSSGSGFGSGGFKPCGSSSFGSGPRSSSDYSKPDYMGTGKMSDPCGPLGRMEEVQIKPIELPEIKIELIEIKPLELNLGIASPPSSLGSAGRKREASPLLEAVTRGHYTPSSSLGSAGRSGNRLQICGTEDHTSSYKLFDEEKKGAPLVRLDITPHHGMPTPHLQYGEDIYTGRKEKEAADLFAHIFKSNPKIKLPWED